MQRLLPLVLLTGCLGPYQQRPDTGDTDDTDVPEDTAPLFITVETAITADEMWRADTTYLLTDLIHVEGTATLTLEAGTVVCGEAGSGLIVDRDATLVASGTAAAPVVFTSCKTVGERAPGDWGGIAVLGSATVYGGTASTGLADASDARGQFGGSDDTDSCGTLSYVRVEFAGKDLGEGALTPGLTLGGCGDTTTVDHIQVHRSLGDGLAIHGGTVDLKNILLSQPGDDALSWEIGWRGRLQYLIAQVPKTADRAIEGSGGLDPFDGTPLSNPTLYNSTLLGPNDVEPETETSQGAIVWSAGTAATLSNSIVASWPDHGVDIVDAATAARSDELSIDHSVLYLIGENEVSWADGDADENDDNGFLENNWIQESEKDNRLGDDPQLREAAWSPTAPNFVPNVTTVTTTGVAEAPDDGFFELGATYLGAVRPGNPVTWYQGWTDFPEN